MAGLELDYPHLSKFARAAHELAVYLADNQGSLINYGERFRAGEHVPSALAESTVDAVVSKRFAKRQRMRWTRRGAHLLCCRPAPAPSMARSARCSSAGIRGSPTKTQPAPVRPPRPEHPTDPHDPSGARAVH